MSKINRVVLVGRLTTDPTAEQTGNGTDVCKCRIAVDGAGQGRGPEAEAGFFDVVSYGNGAKAAASTLTKGSLIGVDGNLRFSSWKDDADKYHSRIEVVGQIDFLSIKKSEGEDSEPADTE